jgi:hypothetical protein
LLECRYDVFISYVRSAPVGPFVENVLFKLFQGWLKEEIEGEPSVFLDTNAIRAGEPLPASIAAALRQSKCLLAICSPSYFRSRWCLSEWESFHEREKVCDRLDSLIVPVLFHEGGLVKQYLAARTYADFRSYTYIDGALFKTEAGLAAQEAIKKLAADVGSRVRDAPPCRSDWPIWTPAIPPAPDPPPGLLLRLSDANVLAQGAAR